VAISSTRHGETIRSTLLEPQKNAVAFFGRTGQAAAPFQGGFLCVQAPVYRLPLKSTGGAGLCSGQFACTLADLLAHPSGGPLVSAGAVVNHAELVPRPARELRQRPAKPADGLARSSRSVPPSADSAGRRGRPAVRGSPPTYPGWVGAARLV
jgi:hypothetical protein